MATFAKVILSGSTNGRGIEAVAVATPGTLIHTAVAGAAVIDEIWLFAVNNDVVSRTLTIEFGGVVDPDDHIEIEIPSQAGLYTIVSGLVLQNSLVIRAFASAAAAVTVYGYVNRITP